MFQKIHPVISYLKEHWEDDAEIINYTAWLEYQYAYSLLKNKKYAESFGVLEESLLWTHVNVTDSNLLITNYIGIIGSIPTSLSKEKGSKTLSSCLKNTIILNYLIKKSMSYIDGCLRIGRWNTGKRNNGIMSLKNMKMH
jgi:hypothetical protein